MSINVGSTASMLLTPWIKDHWGWHAAFLPCCAGLVIGMISYLLLLRTLDGIGSLPDEQPIRWKRLAMVLGCTFVGVFAVAFVIQYRQIAVACVYVAGLAVLGIFGYIMLKGARNERVRLAVALLLIAEALLFFIFYQQMSTSLTLFALRNVDWNQSIFGVHLFTWSPAQYQVLNSIWIMLLSPILVWIYTQLGKSGRDLSIAAKFSLGFVVVAIGFFIYGLGADSAVEGKISSWYMIFGYGFYSLGELLVGALGLAMMSRYAPARMGGFMMGAYFEIGRAHV